MARMLQEIKNEIIQAKKSEAGLKRLSNESQSSISNLIISIVAFAHFILEKLWDKHKSDVQSIIDSKQIFNLKWWAERIKEFQLGDTISLDNNIIKYQIIDPSKRIVSRVSCRESASGDTVIIKVAKNSPPVAFSAEEKKQIEAYINDIKPAGIRVETTSLNADKLRVSGTTFYDAELSQSQIKERVESALQLYGESLEFDGLVYLSKIVDAVQAVPGVKDFQLYEVTLLQGESEVVINRVSEIASGYIIEDDTESFTWSDTINYIGQ